MSGQAPPHAGGEGGADPSMEDILASIRRILSEDDTTAESPAAPSSTAPSPAAPSTVAEAPPHAEALQHTEAPPAPPARPEVLALDSSMLVEDEPGPQPPPPLPGPEHLPSLHAGRIPEPPPPAPSRPAPPPPAPSQAMPTLEDRTDMPPPAPPSASDNALVAPDTAAAAAASVGSLLRSIGTRHNVAVRGGGPTIEDLVRDELRPALRTWLDANLPPLVERLVRAEIERVVGRVDL